MTSQSFYIKMAPTTLKISDKDGIRTIMLSRPDRHNSFTDDMADELVAAFEAANKDAFVVCVILTGDPAGRFFCGGADLGSKDGSDNQFSQMAGVKKDNTSKRPYSVVTHRDSGGVVRSPLVLRIACMQ